MAKIHVFAIEQKLFQQFGKVCTCTLSLKCSIAIHQTKKTLNSPFWHESGGKGPFFMHLLSCLFHDSCYTKSYHWVDSLQQIWCYRISVLHVITWMQSLRCLQWLCSCSGSWIMANMCTIFTQCFRKWLHCDNWALTRWNRRPGGSESHSEPLFPSLFEPLTCSFN